MVSALILGKYHIVTRLGAGAYGLVYSVTDEDVAQNKPAKYAVKLERASKKKPRPPSEHEANVLRVLGAGGTPVNIPRLIDYGYDKSRHSQALVLDLLGADIESLRRACGGKLSISATLLIAINIIPVIKYIHSKYFVHRDIKPGNILLGPQGNEGSITLVDFGFARRYGNPRTGVHQPFIDKKSMIGTVRFASLNTHLGIAQSRRDDIESLAYTLLDCMRPLPWDSIVGGSPKQFEDRVREKKKSWTVDRLCSELPSPFKILLSHARGLAYDEEPGYDFLQNKFLEELKCRGHSPRESWSVISHNTDFAPPLERKKRSSPSTYLTADTTCPWIQPGDFVMVKLLGAATVLYSNSIGDDSSVWHSPSLDGQEWVFPYRPAIVSFVNRDVVIQGNQKGVTVSVYPIMSRSDGLAQIPMDEHRRFISLGHKSGESGSVHVVPHWTRKNTYVYNTCVTLSVSTVPTISSPNYTSSHWRLASAEVLEDASRDLLRVRPSLEAGQPVSPEDGTETIGIKQGKRHILQVVLADIIPLKPDNIDDSNLIWTGRNGWLKEYNQIARRREFEWEGSGSDESSEDYDSDYIYDSISPPGERRASCTVNMNACDW